MTTDGLNLCPTCMHVQACVLTEMKEKVWSCSEYDKAQPEPKPKPQKPAPIIRELALV